MSMNLVVLLYLVASVCFIQALKGLSHPTTKNSAANPKIALSACWPLNTTGAP